MYQEAVSTRYGIEFCCENAIDQDKWAIKKELLDLKMISDPDACQRVPEDCCPPCNVEATLVVIEAIQCPAPLNVDAQLLVGDPPQNCNQIQFHLGPFGIPEDISYTSCEGEFIELTLSGNEPIHIACVDMNQPINTPPTTEVTDLGSCG